LVTSFHEKLGQPSFNIVDLALGQVTDRKLKGLRYKIVSFVLCLRPLSRLCAQCR
jgi:hypothetical protein